MFTMYGVWFMTAQAANRAVVLDFVGTKNRLDKAQEQRDPKDHNNHAKDPPHRAFQRDIPEPCSRQGCDGEIKRINIGVDLFVLVDFKDIHQRGDKENKDHEVQHTHEDLFIFPKEGELVAKILQDVIGPQQSQGPHNPQEREVFDQ